MNKNFEGQEALSGMTLLQLGVVSGAALFRHSVAVISTCTHFSSFFHFVRLDHTKQVSILSLDSQSVRSKCMRACVHVYVCTREKMRVSVQLMCDQMAVLSFF